MTVDLNRNWKTTFGIIWVGQAFSLLGSSLVQFALIWWLTQQTGNATILATASMVSMLPQVFIMPFAGAIVDRFNRQKIMIFADLGTALVTAVLVIITWQGYLQPWHIYLAMFLRAITQTFQWPAMQSAMAVLVPEKNLDRVAGMNQALQGAMNIVAPPLGALLLGIINLEWVLSIDIITAFLAILPLLFVVIPQPIRITEGGSVSLVKTILKDTRIGFRYVVAWKGLMYVIIVAMIINFLINPAFSLLPLLVSKYFGGGALEYSWMESACGIGIVLGGIALGVWGGFKRRIHTSGLGLAGIGVGVLMIGIAPRNLYSLALAGTFVVGFMNPVTNGPLFALVQAKVGKEMQGRVFALISTLGSLMSPLGLLVAGPLSDRFGIQLWFVVGGIICVILVSVMFFLPEVATIDDQLPGYSQALSDRAIVPESVDLGVK